MSSRRDFFQNIYHNQAEQFERLVAREDRHGNLFAALHDIRPLAGLRVVEFGAGTGRITRLLSVMVDQVCAVDIEESMLKQACSAMRASGMTNWRLAQGDNGRMPVASRCADLVIEGWSFAHVVGWYPQDWLERTDMMLAEMERILKPGRRRHSHRDDGHGQAAATCAFSSAGRAIPILGATTRLFLPLGPH